MRSSFLKVDRGGYLISSCVCAQVVEKNLYLGRFMDIYYLRRTQMYTTNCIITQWHCSGKKRSPDCISGLDSLSSQPSS